MCTYKLYSFSCYDKLISFIKKSKKRRKKKGKK
nr:MAG TPA: hypothetical protein [Caudoviricetes sp.]